MKPRSSPSIVAAALVAVAGLASCGASGTNSPEQAALRLELTECNSSNEQRATAVAIEHDSDDLAVTVAHAFENIESFVVQTASGSTIDAELVFRDDDRDLAVLRLDRAAGEALEIDAPNNNDSQVAFITYSDDGGPERKPAAILRFVRLSLDGIGERDGIELGADINSGDSGGPVIDDEGRMIGMVFATSRAGERGWAVSSTEVTQAVESIGNPIALACS